MLAKALVCLMIPVLGIGLAVVCMQPPQGELACGASPPPPPDVQALCDARHNPPTHVPEPSTLWLILPGFLVMRNALRANARPADKT